ncbi:hypothetical protein Pint_26717 [Pistacia integerrima]|uniref:Uncharacterized protein n=1 Tax=Pistacia integerrima TaxID=434235 RepID=A0ACC0YME5_9ROSI|nr:hypothetical protein Pint_26717 [Pistacia integerrima]
MAPLSLSSPSLTLFSFYPPIAQIPDFLPFFLICSQILFFSSAILMIKQCIFHRCMLQVVLPRGDLLLLLSCAVVGLGSDLVVFASAFCSFLVCMSLVGRNPSKRKFKALHSIIYGVSCLPDLEDMPNLGTLYGILYSCGSVPHSSSTVSRIITLLWEEANQVMKEVQADQQWKTIPPALFSLQ